MRRITNLVANLLAKLANLLSIPTRLLGVGHHSLHQAPKQSFAEDREKLQTDWQRVGDDMYRALSSYRNRH